MDIIGHFINGGAYAEGGRAQDVFNPATGQVIRQVELAGPVEWIRTNKFSSVRHMPVRYRVLG